MSDEKLIIQTFLNDLIRSTRIIIFSFLSGIFLSIIFFFSITPIYTGKIVIKELTPIQNFIGRYMNEEILLDTFLINLQNVEKLNEKVLLFLKLPDQEDISKNLLLNKIQKIRVLAENKKDQNKIFTALYSTTNENEINGIMELAMMTANANTLSDLEKKFEMIRKDFNFNEDISSLLMDGVANEFVFPDQEIPSIYSALISSKMENIKLELMKKLESLMILPEEMNYVKGDLSFKTVNYSVQQILVESSRKSIFYYMFIFSMSGIIIGVITGVGRQRLIDNS